MRKKIICILLLLILCFTFFSSCKTNAIDVGGNIDNCKPSASVAVRAMIKKSVYSRENNIEIRVGYGLIASDVLRNYVAEERDLRIVVKADGFTIYEGDVSAESKFEKSTQDYSKPEYIVTKKNNRYMPNYFETYGFYFPSKKENEQGKITITVGFFVEENTGDLDGVVVYYATNKEKIAFSGKSIEEAKKKLK